MAVVQGALSLAGLTEAQKATEIRLSQSTTFTAEAASPGVVAKVLADFAAWKLDGTLDQAWYSSGDSLQERSAKATAGGLFQMLREEPDPAKQDALAAKIGHGWTVEVPAELSTPFHHASRELVDSAGGLHWRVLWARIMPDAGLHCITAALAVLPGETEEGWLHRVKLIPLSCSELCGGSAFQVTPPPYVANPL